MASPVQNLLRAVLILLVSAVATGTGAMTADKCGRCGSCGISRAVPVPAPPLPSIVDRPTAENPFDTSLAAPDVPAVEIPPSVASQPEEPVQSPSVVDSQPARVVDEPPEEMPSERGMTDIGRDSDRESSARRDDTGEATRARQTSRERARGRLVRKDVESPNAVDRLPKKVDYEAVGRLIASLGSLIGNASTAGDGTDDLCGGVLARLCGDAGRQMKKRIEQALDQAREDARNRVRNGEKGENRRERQKLEEKKKQAKKEREKRRKRMKKDPRYRDRIRREEALRERAKRLRKEGRELREEAKRLAEEQKRLEEEERELRRREGELRKRDTNCRSPACRAILEQRRANARALREHVKQQVGYERKAVRYERRVREYSRDAERLERLRMAGYGMTRREHRAYLSDLRHARAQERVRILEGRMEALKARKAEALKEYGKDSEAYRAASKALDEQIASLQSELGKARAFAEKAGRKAIEAKADAHGLGKEYERYIEAERRLKAGKGTRRDVEAHRRFVHHFQEAQLAERLTDEQLDRRIAILESASQRADQAIDAVGGTVPPPSGLPYQDYNALKKRKAALEDRLARMEQELSGVNERTPASQEAIDAYLEAREEVLGELAELDFELALHEPLETAEGFADLARQENRRLARQRDELPFDKDGNLDEEKLARHAEGVAKAQLALSRMNAELNTLRKKKASGKPLTGHEKYRLGELEKATREIQDRLAESGIEVSVTKDGRLRATANTILGEAVWNTGADTVRQAVSEMNRTREKLAKLQHSSIRQEPLPKPAPARKSSRPTGPVRSLPPRPAESGEDIDLRSISNVLTASVVGAFFPEAPIVAAVLQAERISKATTAALRRTRDATREKAAQARNTAQRKSEAAKTAREEADEAVAEAVRVGKSAQRYVKTRVRQIEEWTKLLESSEAQAEDFRSKAQALRLEARRLEEAARRAEGLVMKNPGDRELAKSAEEAARNNRTDAEKKRAEARLAEEAARREAERAADYRQRRQAIGEDVDEQVARSKEAAKAAVEKIEKANRLDREAREALIDANRATKEARLASLDLEAKQRGRLAELLKDPPSPDFFSGMPSDKRHRWLADNIPNWERLSIEQKLDILRSLDFAEQRARVMETGEKIDRFVEERRLSPEGLASRRAEIADLAARLKKLDGQYTLTERERRERRILREKIRRLQESLKTDARAFAELRRVFDGEMRELRRQQWAIDPAARQAEIDRRVDHLARAKAELRLAREADAARERAFLERIVEHRKILERSQVTGDAAAAEKAREDIKRLEAARDEWRKRSTSDISALEEIVTRERGRLSVESVHDNLHELVDEKELDRLAEQRLANSGVVDARLEQTRLNVRAVVQRIENAPSDADPWVTFVNVVDKVAAGISAEAGLHYGIGKGAVTGVLGAAKVVLWEPIDSIGEFAEHAIGSPTNLFGSDNIEFAETVARDPGAAISEMFLGVGKQVYEVYENGARAIQAVDAGEAQLAFEASAKVGETVGEVVLDTALLATGAGYVATTLRAVGKAGRLASTAEKLATGLRVIDEVAAGVVDATAGKVFKGLVKADRIGGLSDLADDISRAVDDVIDDARPLVEVPDPSLAPANWVDDAFADLSRRDIRAGVASPGRSDGERALSALVGPESSSLFPPGPIVIDALPPTLADNILLPAPARSSRQPTGPPKPLAVPPVDPRPVDIQYHPSGKKLRLLRSDGVTLELDNASFSASPGSMRGDIIGEGSFAKTLLHPLPGGENLVIQVAVKHDQGLKDFGRAAVHSIGRPDLVETPKVLQRMRVRSSDPVPHATRSTSAPKNFTGGTVDVVEKAPLDYLSTPHLKASDGGMTAGQAIALNRGLKAINEHGFVVLDLKADNFSFKRVGPPGADQWKLVIIDPGGIIPVKAAAGHSATQNARLLQRAIAAPDDDIVNLYRRGDMEAREKHMDVLARRFDQVVDWGLFRQVTGRDFRSLSPYRVKDIASQTVPFYPGGSIRFERFRALASVPDQALASAEATLRANGPSRTVDELAQRVPPSSPIGSESLTLPKGAKPSANNNQLSNAVAEGMGVAERAELPTFRDRPIAIPPTRPPVPLRHGAPTHLDTGVGLPSEAPFVSAAEPTSPFSRPLTLPASPSSMPAPIPPTAPGVPAHRLAPTQPEISSSTGSVGTSSPSVIEGPPVGGRGGVQAQKFCENCGLVMVEAVFRDLGLVKSDRPQAAMRSFAKERGWLKEGEGMTAEGVARYIEAHGVDRSLLDVSAKTVDEMADALASGKEVMVIMQNGAGGYHWVRMEKIGIGNDGRRWVSYGEGGADKRISKRMRADAFDRLNLSYPEGGRPGVRLWTVTLDAPQLSSAGRRVALHTAKKNLAEGAAVLARDHRAATFARKAEEALKKLEQVGVDVTLLRKLIENRSPEARLDYLKRHFGPLIP